MPKVSQKLRHKILNALAQATIEVLDMYCPDQKNDIPPEGWGDTERRNWDMINEVEMRASKAIEKVLDEVPAKSISGRRISRREALKGLGDPKTWPAESAKLQAEFEEKPLVFGPTNPNRKQRNLHS